MTPSKWGIWGATTFLSLIVVQINCDVIVETRETRRPIRIYEDEPARFGDALPSEGLVGLAVQAVPSHGCTPIEAPPNITLPHNVYWIAVIQRSTPSVDNASQCTFQEKVENAQASKYSGVIVYNYQDDELIPMGGDADVLIPSVFVGKTDGEKILSHYSYPNQSFVLRITENAPFDINSYLLPFAIVVGICFIIMLGIMVFKCIQDRRRERRHRLPKSSLKKIPTRKWQVGDENHYETCCICLDDYVVGDKLRVLPCDHAYHMKCIDPWLLKNKRVCPQCRKKVFANGEVPPSDSDSETEDERAPLLARPRHAAVGAASTFATQNENPFRRAARRRSRSERTSSPGGVSQESQISQLSQESSSSSSTEGQHHAGDNVLVTEVFVEQPRIATSPAAPALAIHVDDDWGTNTTSGGADTARSATVEDTSGYTDDNDDAYTAGGDGGIDTGNVAGGENDEETDFDERQHPDLTQQQVDDDDVSAKNSLTKQQDDPVV